MKSSVARLTPYLLSVLRIVAAFVFIAHGTQKLFGFPRRTSAVSDCSRMFGAAGVLEAFGGTLMLLGLFSRPVAFILSGEMAVAYFTQHAPRGAVADRQRRRARRPVLLSSGCSSAPPVRVRSASTR